jgi:putative nucleotidyltransferase with HDIG domain
MSAQSDSDVRNASRTRRFALQAAESIPPLPDNVVRVLAMLNDRGTEPDDLVRVLEQDPVLVGRMLSMANSPFYGLSHDITSTKQAVMVLGFRGVRSLVLATSTSKFMRQDFSAYGHDQDGLWKHAVVVSAYARAIATTLKCSVDRREELFIAGLLHDIGKMILAPKLSDEGAAGDGRPMTPQAEHDALGLDHAEAGALVASKWNLSPSIQDLIENHEPLEGPATEDELPQRILCVANDLAHAAGIGYLDGMAPAPAASDPATLLGVDASAWEAIAEQAQAAAQSALEQLG